MRIIRLNAKGMMLIPALLLTYCGSLKSKQSNSNLKETPPYQENLKCKRAPGSTLVGQLYAVSGGKETLLSSFNTGHVGSCEFALRSSRNGQVCIEANSSYQVIEIASRKAVKSFARDFDACIAYSKKSNPLQTRLGFVEFMDSKELAKILAHLPNVEDAAINQVLHHPETMWYDEESMIFSYQDSFGDPQGLRANRVGYDVGINASTSDPDIRALTEFFEFGRFKFPFAINAGIHDQSNTYVVNFWAPPLDGSGKKLPVIWWKSGSHWNWVFPVGTVMGEVLMTKNESENEWYVFEVRSRVRLLDSWKTDIFRPFTSADQMAAAIKQERPNWSNSDLLPLVSHLEDSSNLVPAKLESTPYKQIFPTINGFYDVLPGTNDASLIKSFLSQRTFTSAMNKKWKTSGDKITYAATTNAGFNIVPQGSIAGLLETSEASCTRCHNQAGRPLRQLDERVVLYGEIWGEDQIFTWHPFKQVREMFSVSNGSRYPNPRMIEAGLLQERAPGVGEPNYKELLKPYPTDYRNK